MAVKDSERKGKEEEERVQETRRRGRGKRETRERVQETKENARPEGQP